MTEYSNFTVKKLKELCLKEGLSVKGNKQQLVEALEQHSSAASIPCSEENSPALCPKENVPPVAALKKLKELCLKEGLPTKGNKQQLAEALEQHLSAASIPIPEVNKAASASAPANHMEDERSAEELKGVRSSSRIPKPRTCTMCAGCSHHSSSTIPVVLDDVSIGQLANQFASSVNIVTVTESVPKISKVSKPRSVRAPLKVQSNQTVAVGVSAGGLPEVAQMKAVKGKVGGSKKTKTIRDILGVEAGKENMEVPPLAARPGRKATVKAE